MPHDHPSPVDHRRHGAHEAVPAAAEPHGEHASGGHAEHHATMIADFRRRLWVSMALTLPVVLISPMMGLGQLVRFPGDAQAAFALSSVIFFYGGWPFLSGLVEELR